MSDLASSISARANAFKFGYVATFKVDCDGRPYHAGTITAVAFPNVTVLVTAAHVLERDMRNKCDEENQIFVFMKDGLRQVQRFHTSKLPLPNGELLDLTIFVPEGMNIAEIAQVPIPATIIRRLPLHEQLYLGACGFPESKNRRKGRDLSSRPYGYFGKIGKEAAVIRAGYDPRFYFSIKIDLKRVYRGNLKEVIAPAPEGISGGPVFTVFDFNDSTFDRTELAGIVVARDKQKKHLICVKGEFIEHIVSAAFSDGAIK